MRFMRIIIQGPCGPFYNMALDEAVSEAVRRRLSPPTLRLYEWNAPSLSIGYFQKSSDIDTDYCTEQNYPVVRRLTGGRAILHDAELTYSFSSPADCSPFRGNLMDAYTVISSAMIRGLQSHGIDAFISHDRKRPAGHRNAACFKAVSFGEITVAGRKIIGSAQKRYPDGFIQHGSVLFGFNPDALRRALKLGSEVNLDGIGALNDFAPGLTVKDLITSLKKSFETVLDVKMIPDEPTAEELRLAEELEEHKYSTPEWNYRR